VIYRPILLTVAMAWALGVLGPHLDGITFDDHGHEVEQAKDLEDAQRAAQVRKRFEDAAQRLCGPQSAWREISQGVIECKARRGLPSTTLSFKE
jgi:hypothetical protein